MKKAGNKLFLVGYAAAVGFLRLVIQVFYCKFFS